MSVSHFPARDPLALVPEDCGRGHACQFCPEDEHCNLDKGQHEKRLIESRLADIGQIIMVMANKGGVGKSTVSANLAAGLAAQGYSVGVADADIHGPNQSRFFGFVGDRIRLSKQGLAPKAFTHQKTKQPIQVGSLAFMMETDDTPIVWRDAYKHDFMHHLIGSFDWGALDFLVIDMPPGTGNELITLADLLEGHDVAALLTTTPQEVALMDSLKAVSFCHERKLPLIGLVENMAGVTCPNCTEQFHVFPRGHLAEALAAANIKSIAQIPLSLALSTASDQGVPVMLAQADSPEAQAFAPMVQACIKYTQEVFTEAATQTLHTLGQDQLSTQEIEQAVSLVPADEQESVRQQLQALLGVSTPPTA